MDNNPYAPPESELPASALTMPQPAVFVLPAIFLNRRLLIQKLYEEPNASYQHSLYQNVTAGTVLESTFGTILEAQGMTQNQFWCLLHTPNESATMFAGRPYACGIEATKMMTCINIKLQSAVQMQCTSWSNGYPWPDYRFTVVEK